MSKIRKGLHQFTVVIDEEKFLMAQQVKVRSWRTIIEEALERETLQTLDDLSCVTCGGFGTVNTGIGHEDTECIKCDGYGYRRKK